MMLYYVPIEPLEERYTEQWYRWFPDAMRKMGVPYVVIDGTPLLEGEIKVGTFLDVNSTAHYKFSQLAAISELFHRGEVQDGDVFFIADIEFWGIEVIRYLATLNKVDVKIIGFCHAASYTKGDFMEPCKPFAKYAERTWFEICDKVLVGSEYHKKELLAAHPLDNPDKVVVTGNPYDIAEVQRLVGLYTKRKRVIVTNRPDPDKGVMEALGVLASLAYDYPNYEFMVCTSRKKWGEGETRESALKMQEQGILTIKEGLSKKEYLTLLAESQIMISNTKTETFGYCMLEAMIFGTIPIVPDAFSLKELVPSAVRFNSVVAQDTLISRWLNNDKDRERMARQLEVMAWKYNSVAERIIMECVTE